MRWLRTLALTGALGLPLLHSHAAETVTVGQKNRSFAVRELTVGRGSIVGFKNDDDYAHQLRITGTGLDIDSELQPPGEKIDVLFPMLGSFEVRCGIHPRMRMTVNVQ